MNDTSLNRRYERQQDIVPEERLKEFTPTIIGCGAVGSMVARQLAHMGSDMTLMDFDTVDEVNLSCQGFVEKDLGLLKIDAIENHVHAINSTVEVNTTNYRFGPSFDSKPFRNQPLFCCVDKIEVRGMIYNKLRRYLPFFIDGRMVGGAEIRIIQACDDDSKHHYPTTLFAEEEAVQGRCTAKSTIFGAFVTAGMMVSAYARWLKNPEGYFMQDAYLNLAAMELFAVEPEPVA